MALRKKPGKASDSAKKQNQGVVFPPQWEHPDARARRSQEARQGRAKPPPPAQRRKKPSAAKAGRAPKRRRRRGSYAIYYILLLLIVIITGVVLSLTVFFKIQNITVTGQAIYPPEELIATSGILTQENIFKVETQAPVENILARYGYIEEVRIRRRLPDTIVIEATPAKPLAAILSGGEYTIISTKGRVMEKELQHAPENLTTVLGPDTSVLEVCSYIGESDAEWMKMLGYVTQAIEENAFSGVTLIDLTDRLDIVIIYDNRINLLMGSEAQMSYKVKFVKDVIENRLEAGFTGSIDVSDPPRAVARPQAAVQPDLLPEAADEPQGDT